MKLKLLFILLIINNLISAQNHQTKKIGDKEYYVYSVLAGEGLFAVSRKFGVLQSEIIAANPNLDKGLKAGQTLYIPVQSSIQNFQNQQDNSKKIIEHTVLPKQTFFSICKIYGVSQEEILALNPDLEPTKIKIGQVIKIPAAKKMQEVENKNATVLSVKKNDEKQQTQSQKAVPKQQYILYEVKKKKESLYSISREFGVSINELLEANPEAENGIQKGYVLKIPVTENSQNQQQKPQNEQQKEVQKKSNVTTHTVQPKETIYGISKQYNVPQDELIAANPQIKDGLKIGQTLAIPPQTAKENIQPEYETVPKENVKITETAKKYLKIAFLLPFTNENKQNANTERFTEFYRGALLALEDVKTQGFTANIQTFDTGFGTSSFYRILSEKFFEDVDLIVGPAYPEQVSVVAAFAKKHKIVQVVPFTSKIDKADKHEYLYQFNPATEDIAQVVADDFIEKFSKHNIVFVNFADKDGKGAKFADVLRKNLKNKAIKYQDIFADDAVENALKGKNSILVFATSNYENFSKIFQNLNNPNTNDLKFWVTEEISEKLPEIKNIYSYSLFNNNVSKNYLQRYEKWFGLRSCKSVPCYDLLGYDITSYFCNADFNPLTSTFSNSNSALFLQSNFDFSMQKNGKGYLNYGYFLNCDFCKQ